MWGPGANGIEWFANQFDRGADGASQAFASVLLDDVVRGASSHGFQTETLVAGFAQHDHGHGGRLAVQRRQIIGPAVGRAAGLRQVQHNHIHAASGDSRQPHGQAFHTLQSDPARGGLSQSFADCGGVCWIALNQQHHGILFQYIRR